MNVIDKMELYLALLKISLFYKWFKNNITINNYLKDSFVIYFTLHVFSSFYKKNIYLERLKIFVVHFYSTIPIIASLVIGQRAEKDRFKVSLGTDMQQAEMTANSIAKEMC